jgi:hypothetical protein
MVDRSNIPKALIIADRGYESYNLMAHIQEKGWKYLIRVKDIHSSGIAAGLDLPDTEEFDLYCPVLLTRRNNSKTKPLLSDRNHYKWIPTTTPFDYLPIGAHKHDPVAFYALAFRIVRFKLSESAFETVITNLDQKEFPSGDLKHLYSKRWGIETSFRELKYTVGLLHFHAKKVENITQEIFARLIMYNFAELITSHVVIQKKCRKYVYQTNFTAAVHICRQFLRDSVAPPKVVDLIKAQVVPIRPGRSTPRRTKNIKFNGFFYRIA